MAGQIIKRGDKTWIVRIFTGRDEQGKRRYLNKTIHGTKKDANTYLSATLTAISAGTFVEPTPLTLGAYLDRWLDAAARPRVRARTLDDYTEYLKRYVRPALGDKRLSDVRPLDVQKLYSDMQARALSPRTVRYAHTILSSAFKQAVKWGMLARNPCQMVEIPRQVRREMYALSATEAARFLGAAEGDRYALVFSVALSTGMRPEEYLALQWKDICFERGVVTVRRALVYNRKGGGWYFDELKTSRSRRNIPLGAAIARGLKEHRRQQNEERLKAGSDYQNHDLVFATMGGTPILLSNLFRRHFKPIALRAKLPGGFRLYDLRHSCATLLLAANEHPKVVSERLGHASIVLTLDTYSHVLPSMQQAASEKMESILFKQKSSAS